MNIANINSTVSPGITNPASGKSELSQESFMRMLLAQLKMQNPLNPFDSSTMMQQIAQLTSLSSTQKLAESMETFKSNLGTTQVLEASQLVGKNVEVATETIQLEAGRQAHGAVIVPMNVENIEVGIFDASGKQIRTLKLPGSGEGVLDFTWDGLDESGKIASPGFYTLAAKTEVGGEDIKMTTASTFKVNSVALDRQNGGIILNVDGLGGVSMNELIKIL